MLKKGDGLRRCRSAFFNIGPGDWLRRWMAPFPHVLSVNLPSLPSVFAQSSKLETSALVNLKKLEPLCRSCDVNIPSGRHSR